MSLLPSVLLRMRSTSNNAFRTASDRKLGGAWERGYAEHVTCSTDTDSRMTCSTDTDSHVTCSTEFRNFECADLRN